MDEKRLFGYAFDLRACATLGENTSTRSVFDVSTRAPALSGHKTVVDHIHAVASELGSQPQRIELNDIVARIRSEQKPVDFELPSGFLFVRTGDVATGQHPSFGVVSTTGFDRDALLGIAATRDEFWDEPAAVVRA